MEGMARGKSAAEGANAGERTPRGLGCALKGLGSAHPEGAGMRTLQSATKVPRKGEERANNA